MWQPFIIPDSLSAKCVVGTEPIVGKLHTSRKEARIEAKRMIKTFVAQVCGKDNNVEIPMPVCGGWGLLTIRVGGLYDTLAEIGVRWQPEEVPS